MKIAMVCHPTSGGSGILGTELGLALAKKGHSIHFISSEIPFRLTGSWKKNVFYHEVETLDYPLFKYPPYDLFLTNKIYDIAIQNKIDIIHTHYAIPHSVCSYLAREMVNKTDRKIAVINTVHGTDVSLIGQDSALKDVIGFSLKNSDVVTSVSNNMAEEAMAVYGLKEKPIVINNFVDVKPLVNPPEDLREIFGTNKAKIITHISNFRAIKRIEDVIKIFAKIIKKIDAKLLLIGDGPEQKKAYRMVARLGLLNRVHFLGLQSSIIKLLSITDLFLLPSEKENFSLSALEAMSCGVPVVATKVGGMPEMIKSNVNGFLAEIGDIDLMAKYSIDLLSDNILYQKISNNAKKKVEKYFTPEKIIPQYEKVYSKVIKKIQAKK